MGDLIYSETSEDLRRIIPEIDFDVRLRPSINKTYAAMREARKTGEMIYDEKKRRCTICRMFFEIEKCTKVVYFKDGKKNAHWYCNHCFKHRSRVSKLNCKKYIIEGKNYDRNVQYD